MDTDAEECAPVWAGAATLYSTLTQLGQSVVQIYGPMPQEVADALRVLLETVQGGNQHNLRYVVGADQVTTWSFDHPQEAGRMADWLNAGKLVTEDMKPVRTGYGAGWGVVRHGKSGPWRVTGLGH